MDVMGMIRSYSIDELIQIYIVAGDPPLAIMNPNGELIHVWVGSECVGVEGVPVKKKQKHDETVLCLTKEVDGVEVDNVEAGLGDARAGVEAEVEEVLDWLRHVSFQSKGESEDLVDRQIQSNSDSDSEYHDAHGAATTEDEDSSEEVEDMDEATPASGEEFVAQMMQEDMENNYENLANINRMRGELWDMNSTIKGLDIGLYSTFRNPYVFHLVFKTYAAKQGFDYRFMDNEPSSIAIMCRQEGCHFWCRYSRVGEGSMMQIVVWGCHDNCGGKLQNKQITSDFLAFRYLSDIRNAGKMTAKTLRAIIQGDLGVTPRRSSIYRTLSKAKELISGNLGKQYEDLETYCEMIKKANKGSKAKVEFGKNSRFRHMYIRYVAQKQAFLGCRPIVGLDGCQLKGRFGGQLLSAVARDADDGMYPLVIAIIGQENKETCREDLMEEDLQ